MIGLRDDDRAMLRIDDRAIEARPGESLLRAARRAGIAVPGLCDHEVLRPYGACRLCVVEVVAAAAPGRPPRSRIVTACDFPVREGLEVRTATETVLGLRRQIVRLHLARAPEAPILRALAEELGAEPLDPAEAPDGCILCGLCVRVCAEAVGAHALGFAARGKDRVVGTPYGEPSGACVGCGACDWICPTGILRQQAAASATFRMLPGEERLCRWARLGVVPGALCALSYECERCDVEASMRERFGPEHPAIELCRRRAAAGGGGRS
ncbi:MAG: (2Fe-2S)-binding protein [Deltaproteobacteria bacterium]|nr:(2Fe-2S)-binding protein [Deltaproteobacteria bacterium]